MGKGADGGVWGTSGAIEEALSLAKSIAPNLSSNPNNLISLGFVETTHEKMVNRKEFTNQSNGLVIEFDKGIEGANGFRGRDHYHIKNPKSNEKNEYYLDINGNPVPRHSDKSHIFPKKGE